MYDLPISVEINNHHFAITNKGDYRMVIDCFLALEDVELSEEERMYSALIIFYEDLAELEDVESVFGDNLEEALKAMFNFFNCNQPEIGYNAGRKLIDWGQDEQLIVSAINKVAGKEVRFEPYIHWWTFMGYYMNVGEGPLATVVSIRDKINKGKKLDKSEREFQQSNPHYFIWKNKTIEEQEADAYVRALWEQNSKSNSEEVQVIQNAE